MNQNHFSFSRAALFGVLLAFFAVAGSLSAKDDAPTRLLNAELPHGTVLESASCAETVYATRQAVRKNPNMAVALMQRAISSRTPGQHSARERDGKDGVVPCECLTRIVQAAVESAPPAKVHELIEVAMSTQPQCAQEITDLTKKQRIDGKDAPVVASNTRGARPPGDSGQQFGDGLIGDGYNTGTGGADAGFPGSPGFIGSAPSGSSIFPPVVVAPLTSVSNP